MGKVNNPFSLAYGKTPTMLINRMNEFNRVLDDFNAENPSITTYIITGLRGTGKTVLLRNLSKSFEELNDWVVVDINPQSNILLSFSDKLYVQLHSLKLSMDWSLSVNVPYVSLTLSKGNSSINNPELIAEKLIESASKKKKRILITIDEVNKTDDFKLFVNFYQSMIGKNYPVYMLMTGIRNNIDQLISDEAMTFLSRSPKVELGPLDLKDIMFEYKNVFNISDDVAAQLSKLTGGYAFAYQVLGYLFFEKDEKVIDKNLLSQYDKYLSENGYNTFWRELTPIEKQFCIALAESQNGDVDSIKKKTGMLQSNFNNYRARLLRKEILVSKGYGNLEFTLPRFKEYVLIAKQFE